MSITSLTARARAGTLEVEHLLKEARYPDPALADTLAALSAELAWPMAAASADVGHAVPLGAWARAVSVYARDGLAGLLPLAAEPDQGPFVIGLLEEHRTGEALDALLLAFDGIVRNPGSDTGLALRLATAFNTMLSFKPRAPADAHQASRLRDFLHRLHACSVDDAGWATVLLALRGIGDDSSVALALSRALAEPWRQVPQLVAKHIRKRMQHA